MKDALTRIPGCEADFCELPCGDFLVAPDAAIERKTAGDFVSSILDGRFIAQARLLSDAYPRSFWIIEGDQTQVRSAITPAAMVGAVSYVCALLRSTVLYTSDTDQTALAVATIARHLQEGLGYVPNLRPGKPKNASGYAEFIIGGLPGIGGAKAQLLLRHFGSAAAVKGISARIAADIRFALDTKHLANRTEGA